MTLLRTIINKNSIIPVLLISLLFLPLAGCWDRRELDDLAIVAGTAVDKSESPEEIEVSAQIINPGQVQSPGSQGSGNGQAVTLVKSSNKGVFDAIRDINKSFNRKPFWAHNRIIIISEELAKEGIHRYLDFFYRDHEPYPTAYILISQGRASSLLELKPSIGNIEAFGLAELVENQAATSFSPEINLQQFIDDLLSESISPIAPLGMIIKEKDKELVRLGGTAVFKSDKLAGVFNEKETRGLLWIKGLVKGGIIEFPCPDKDKDIIALEIKSAKGKIEPQIIDNRIRMNINIDITSDIGELMCFLDLKNPSIQDFLKEQQEKVIKEEIQSAITQGKNLQTDVFGFGTALHHKYPALWKELAPDWGDYLPELDYVVTIKSKLRRTGIIIKPTHPH